MCHRLGATLATAVLVVVISAGALHAARSARPRSGESRQELPEGPGKAEVSKLCAGCHDLMFTVSTRETEEGWTRIVNDMRSKGADGSDEDFAKVVTYLAKHMGKPQPSHR